MNTKNFQLIFGHGGRGFGGRIHRLQVLREGFDVADVLGLAKNHRETVQTEGDAAMGRGAITEGVDEPTELLGDILVG